MKILALDIGKYKSVACDYQTETGGHSFVVIATNPRALHDLIVDREPDRSAAARSHARRSRWWQSAENC